jgi:hypothetical protein
MINRLIRGKRVETIVSKATVGWWTDRFEQNAVVAQGGDRESTALRPTPVENNCAVDASIVVVDTNDCQSVERQIRKWDRLEVDQRKRCETFLDGARDIFKIELGRSNGLRS